MKTKIQLNNASQPSSQQIKRFVDEVKRAYFYDGPRTRDPDRRTVERINLTMPVTITPLDEEYQPLGYQFEAISRDLSVNGIGLVTTNPLGHYRVLLTMEPLRGEPFQILANISYCNDFGYYFQVGCEFLCP